MKEIITIRASKYLSDELAKKVAQMCWGTSAPQYVNCVRKDVFDGLTDENDCFEVIAVTAKGEVVGRVHCIRNETDFSLWCYGDLFVTPEYRRMGIARQNGDKPSFRNGGGCSSLLCRSGQYAESKVTEINRI